jgi:hypothetical protein
MRKRTILLTTVAKPCQIGPPPQKKKLRFSNLPHHPSLPPETQLVIIKSVRHVAYQQAKFSYSEQ